MTSSKIGQGTYQFDPSWGEMDEKDIIEVIHSAYNHGIRYFNSAYYYGKGYCEEVLGKALKSLPRDDYTIATKIGITKNQERNLSREHLRQEMPNILKRLGVKHIDILLLHAPDDSTPIKDTMDQMLAFQKDGIINHIGLSNFSVEQIKEAKKHASIYVCEFYHSLLTRENDDVLEYCFKHDILITPFKVIERGLLTDKFDSKNKDLPAFDKRYPTDYVKEKNLQRMVEFIMKLKAIAFAKKCTLAQLAIAWALQQGGATCPLVGMRSVAEVDEDSKATEVKLSSDDIRTIDQLRDELILH